MRATLVSFEKAPTKRLSLFALISIVGAVAAQVPPQDEIRSALMRARGLLEAGEFRSAESSYVILIGKIPQEQRTALATAHFGRAFAAQKRLFSGDTLINRTPVDTILRSYELAARLNETELREATENNIAQLLRALGRHEEAIGRFNNAAKFGTKTKQASYLLYAGREYLALADTTKARFNYQEAIKADPGATEALRGLLLLQLQRDSASTILQTIAPLRGDSASAPIVADALTSLLQSKGSSLNAADAKTTLLYLAQSLPAARIGPPSFDVALAERLRLVIASSSPVADGVRALVDAFAARTTPYTLPAQSSWWQSSDDRRAAWSSILRSLGDWYELQNNPLVARSYYEAAIGRESWDLMSPWVDRRALLPLALIYSRTDPGKDAQFQNQVAQLTDVLFSGKGAAYGRGDLEEIRTFHTALGAIYASKGQWTGSGPRNAEFQLEHMREVTAQLSRQSRRTLTDPAELLEKLAEHYQEAGKTYQATSVKQQIKTDYARRGRAPAGDSVIMRIEAKK